MMVPPASANFLSCGMEVAALNRPNCAWYSVGISDLLGSLPLLLVDPELYAGIAPPTKTITSNESFRLLESMSLA